ncbi:SRPBCC domain-containing protein [Flaviramulus sp. BrNp1-15]|uniref:SRPBCC family protein n=1 Tax=Flaviramulus sp. BrNp1-15 TaxID=2916754 RepID=UPI001EE7BF3E|nr:SRPBCC domain-containing protein [Flaviramulus sp. BrNp1-15]ULC58152.1 SRPBCC domain-containing protein [Flaviramulus sp. BrNp1-15]
MIIDNLIIVEQTFNKPIATVWNSITKPLLMKQWFFEQIEDFEAKKGFKTQFIVKVENRVYTHLWEIIEVIPNKKIVYDWRYLEYKEGVGKVIFELSETNNKTKLTLTNEGLETFPKNVPEFSFESCEGGWDYFINQRLAQFLESNNSNL